MQLARNKQLDSFFVRNLNQDPTGWALEDQSMDAALCCVSVQYLQQVTMLPSHDVHQHTGLLQLCGLQQAASLGTVSKLLWQD